MATTVFSNGTVILPAWLEDVDAMVYGDASPPSTPIRIFTGAPVGSIEIDASGHTQIGSNAPNFGQLNVQRHVGAPYSSLVLGDAATPANTVGFYLRQTSGTAGISTAGAALAFYRAGPATTPVLTLGASGNVTIEAPGSGNTVTVTGLAGQNTINLPNVNNAAPIRMNAKTVANLLAAATAGAGAKDFVSDANATTFASVVAGGGANPVPVYSDGTNWRIG